MPSEETQFKKGYDPKRHIKKKGEVWTKTKVLNFIEEYWRYLQSKGKMPEEKLKEIFESFDKLATKDFRALKELLDRLFGRPTTEIELKGKLEMEKLIEIERKMARALKEGEEKFKKQNDN